MAIVADQVDEETAAEGAGADAIAQDPGITVEDDAAQTEIVEEAPPAARRPSSWLRIWLVVGLITAVLALTGNAVRVGLDVRAQHRADTRDQAITDTARQVAVLLVSLNHNTAKDDLDAIAASSTGDFRAQFDKLSGTFTGVLNDGKVESTGEVKAIAIVAANDNNATVLTAITSTVKNTEAPEGQQRAYRTKMTLGYIDGRWLVSNVEFIA
ncbi:hypothetical protein IU487_32490 [Nocardia puris]|uniref:hypothetical protein n=1 Tax=Nocardia puris TaxID=208602 RepID=UPI001894C91A|nr:hypothetical protein [Nocardia puris]MBF6215717.1 hypothetical protein [Nocardia puris]